MIRRFLARAVNRLAGHPPTQETPMAYRAVATDTSGRPIRMSPLMEKFWAELCDRLGFTPTIVQGAWMQGGGASASAGYHDQGGCLDLRTWDRTNSEVAKIIQISRELGAPAWVRDQRHGMDPHIHLVVGGDEPMAWGARWQITEYAAGRNGLTSRGHDYHPRPLPLRLKYVPKPPQEDDVSAEEVWNHPVATDAGDVPAKIALRRSLSQSTRGRLAAEAAMSGVGDLAKLIRTMPGAGDDLKKLADDIVTRTAAAVKRLDAESVAQQLEVKPKGS